MNEKEEIIRGHAAQDLLDNPLFKDAVSAIRDGIVSKIADSAMGDEKTHNRLAIALQIINQIERQLITHIQTGRMAAIQVNTGMVHKFRNVIGG
jgi:hypothetical protein